MTSSTVWLLAMMCMDEARTDCRIWKEQEWVGPSAAVQCEATKTKNTRYVEELGEPYEFYCTDPDSIFVVSR